MRIQIEDKPTVQRRTSYEQIGQSLCLMTCAILRIVIDKQAKELRYTGHVTKYLGSNFLPFFLSKMHKLDTCFNLEQIAFRNR